MNDQNKTSSDQSPDTPKEEEISPDDLVHMYGGFLYVIVPVILIALIVYFFFIR